MNSSTTKISKIRLNTLCILFSMFFLGLMSFTSGSHGANEIGEERQDVFISKSLAVSKIMTARFGIPTTLLTSVAIHTSQSGHSLPSIHANNHFKLLSDSNSSMMDDNSFIYKGDTYQTFSTDQQCYQTFVLQLLSNAHYDQLEEVNWYMLLKDQGYDMNVISDIHKSLLHQI